MSATWVTFAFEAANFLLLAALLAWLFFRPVRAALERRRSQLESEQHAAAEALAKADGARKQAIAQRIEQETELGALRERLRGEAEHEKQTLIESARTQMKRERERLEQELVGLRRAQTRTIARDGAFAANAIVLKLLAELKGPELEEALVSSACRGLEQLRGKGSLAPIVIESAVPLAPALQARLAAAAGTGAGDATQRVDPELIGGLRVLTPRGLVDASVAGISAQAERLLMSRIDGENNQHE